MNNHDANEITKMNRRQFTKSLAGTMAIATLPKLAQTQLNARES